MRRVPAIELGLWGEGEHRFAALLDRLFASDPLSVIRAMGRIIADGSLSWHLRFTLLEMVIVISIILILISVAVPSYQEHVRKAREAVRKTALTGGGLRVRPGEVSLEIGRAHV